MSSWGSLERFLKTDPGDAGCAETFELLDRYVCVHADARVELSHAALDARTEHLGLAVPLLAAAAGFAVITAGLAALRVPAFVAESRPAATVAGLRAAGRDRCIIGAAAAVVTAGLSTGAGEIDHAYHVLTTGWRSIADLGFDRTYSG